MKIGPYLCLGTLLLIAPTLASAGDKAPIVLKHDAWVAAVAFSPDGKFLASGSADKNVRLWTVGEWKNTVTLKGTDSISCLAYEPRYGTYNLLTGSFDGGTLVHLLFLGDGINVERAKYRGAVLAIAVNPVTNEMATGGIDGVITMESKTPDKKELVRLSSHRSWVNSLAFNRAGTLLASGSSDGTVRIWRQSDNYQSSAELQGGAGEVRAVAFSPDGKRLAAGNRYGTVRVWDVASTKEVTTLAGHASEVWSIAFSPDGKTLAAADTDWKKPSKVKLWDTATWKERGALDTPGEILSIAYSPAGDWLAVGCWDKTVRVFAIKK